MLSKKGYLKFLCAVVDEFEKQIKDKESYKNMAIDHWNNIFVDSLKAFTHSEKREAEKAFYTRWENE